MSEHVKLHFTLEQDEDGYPPLTVESLWATPTQQPDEYVVDNVPFYMRGVALGDLVIAREDEEGALWFLRVKKPSGHSTIRVIMTHAEDANELLHSLCSLGCRWEGSNAPRLFSVDVPPAVEYEVAKTYLDEKEAQGLLEYEEGCLGFGWTA